MKRLDNQEIINTYVKIGLKCYEAYLTEKYTKVNKYYPKIKKMFKYLERNIDVAKEILPQLLKHEIIDVRSIASSHCLMLGIYVEEAEKTLQEIANDEKKRIWAFETEMTLKVWKEGNLRIEQEK